MYATDSSRASRWQQSLGKLWQTTLYSQLLDDVAMELESVYRIVLLAKLGLGFRIPLLGGLRKPFLRLSVWLAGAGESKDDSCSHHSMGKGLRSDHNPACDYAAPSGASLQIARYIIIEQETTILVSHRRLLLLRLFLCFPLCEAHGMLLFSL